jgi:hypothetical protein
MTKVSMPRKALEELLTATLRPQNVNGSNIDQVDSCVIDTTGNTVSTLCIVKDGTTSLSSFSFAYEGLGTVIPVPSIHRLLGVLKFHSDVVTLESKSNSNKVIVRSKGKQTTLLGGFDALSYANSQMTLTEADEKAYERARSIDGNTYVMANGERRTAFAVVRLDAKELYEALRCDAINGQRLNRYKFAAKRGELTVTVGDPFKGETTTFLENDFPVEDFEATFEGGLENVVKHYSKHVVLNFFDFREEGQGIRLLINFDNGDWVFQCGVL